MQSPHVKCNRPIIPRKQVKSHARAGVEVDLRGVPRREILVGENCPTHGFEKRYELFPMREVVLQHQWIDDAARRRLPRRIELIKRQNLRIPLQSSAQHAAAVLIRQHTAKASADTEHVNVRILAQPGAASCEQAEIPLGMLDRRVVLRKGGAGDKKKKKAEEGFSQACSPLSERKEKLSGLV